MMADLTGIVVLMLLLVASEARVGDSTETSFCTETKECLEYDLVCKNEEYEVRHYDSTKWVSADAQSYFMEVAINRGFMKLFRYIQGANDAGVKIDMTAPVIIKTKEDRSVWQQSNYTVSFLFPSRYQNGEAIPKPTEESVYLTNMPESHVYVKSYGGWMLDMTSRYYSRHLREQLDAVQASYKKDVHYDVGYDSPMKIFNRHNEVWYIVDGKPVCPAAK
ncbi:heme-binding protein 2 [Denticeps clupeoides]|uniref:Heme-binding protein 1 n=1 Tax=Denticeps clupeoides TaxID=299321 RepID=A0AAY4APM9_9TELE|nr:heme-binding protein 2-like [Denticeps clupeoides]XP_028841790.1 heme-binding protein 2-like [Denticeps clupeoides]